MSLILVTGGLGYIGSHTTLKLLENGFDVLVIDSLINTSKKVIENIEKILDNSTLVKKGKIIFRQGDIRDYELLNSIFKEFNKSKNSIESVIHFAGLKSISNSILNPIEYWDVNVKGTISLLSAMNNNSCFSFIFSSSATIYNSNSLELIKENRDLKPINPYGNTKLTTEKILNDLFVSNRKKWKIVSLRYFNPAGAHFSGLLGENSKLRSSNLFPKVIDVIEKRINYLPIYGQDWPTHDGTCVRDFIHITDLAEAHLLSLKFLMRNEPQNISLNIGTGKGASILDVLNTFKSCTNYDLKYKFVKRREGDYPYVVADNSLAKNILKWAPNKKLIDMCKDALNFNT
ncbi:UDP-glucose 4-epimerase GalE, partial [Prochlorococcus sp. AH-716-E13]|nr:UDP-glucose 4-epimerase GalE [Prochlorococcus sp. AH-716-E13]